MQLPVIVVNDHDKNTKYLTMPIHFLRKISWEQKLPCKYYMYNIPFYLFARNQRLKISQIATILRAI